ncbi:hypothetical protein LNQ03_03445 [Klebsiella pneumoniae subsp. pneumoniae]|nr:hypothetical protein [Klebsiella pneumoniae subsp. pneumoniae]
MSVTIDQNRQCVYAPLKAAAKPPGLPPIVSGSHIDTQPTGGKFDGQLRRSAPAALEVERTLNDLQIDTDAPRSGGARTNEEGSRLEYR